MCILAGYQTSVPVDDFILREFTFAVHVALVLPVRASPHVVLYFNFNIFLMSCVWLGGWGSNCRPQSGRCLLCLSVRVRSCACVALFTLFVGSLMKRG